MITKVTAKLEIEDILKGRVSYETPLAPYTTWKIGGPAQILAFPKDEPEVINALAWARREGIKVTVLGAGTNVLIKDGGIRGLVLYLARGLKDITIEGNLLRVGAGTTWATAIKQARQKKLGGMEFGTGIPGTLGGAVRGNAGAYGSAIGNLVASLSVIGLEGRKRTLLPKDLDFQYRKSNITSDIIILEAELKLEPADPHDIDERCKQIWEQRKKRLPPQESACAGSVFKNLPGQAAGKLIEDAGLKGKNVGKAAVSAKHANFIINQGGATARDVLTLINLIQDKIYRQYRIVLEPEIVVLGQR